MLTNSRSRDRRSAGPDEVFARLAESFRLKQAKLGVIGLGYVGLPICLAAVNAGFKVLGLDIDPGKPEALKEGQSYLRHIPAAHIASAMATGRFEVTSAMQRLSEPDALLICVPTPLSAHLDPDISFIVSTAETITQYLRRGQLVVLEFDHLSRHHGRGVAPHPGKERATVRP